MKVKIFAILVLILILTASALNTHFVLKTIDTLTEAVEALPTDGTAEAAETLFSDYKKKEGFLSLTVSHNDLTDIESFFSETVGYLSVKDADGAQMAKSRLLDALTHLRRLSGVNISSVF
ncbi:MAG: DUF4363 family protein [Clostridia bacterium]|nr:DUF4363 family protein [Clostridia bacterium]